MAITIPELGDLQDLEARIKYLEDRITRQAQEITELRVRLSGKQDRTIITAPISPRPWPHQYPQWTCTDAVAYSGPKMSISEPQFTGMGANPA